MEKDIIADIPTVTTAVRYVHPKSSGGERAHVNQRCVVSISTTGHSR